MGKTPKPWMASTNNSAPRRWTTSASSVQIVPPAVGIANPANGDDPRALVAGGLQSIEVEFSALGLDAAGFHAPIGQVQPGILIRGEFVGPGDHVVARLPGKAFGHQIDAGRGIADQGDFLDIGPDHPGRSPAEVFDLLHPSRVKGCAV